MLFCKNCGVFIPDGSKLCPNCGESVEIMSEDPSQKTDDVLMDTDKPEPSGAAPKKRKKGVIAVVVSAAALAVLACLFIFVGLPLLKPMFDFQYRDDGYGNYIITKYTGNDKNVVIPDEIYGHTVTQIGAGAFIKNDLQTVEFGNAVHTIGNNAFEYCENLTGVYVRDLYDLDSLNLDSMIIGDSAFANCGSLRSANLKFTCEYGVGAFQNCTALNDVNPECRSISYRAFANCVSLTNDYVIADSIGKEAFSGCVNLGSGVDMFLIRSQSQAYNLTIGESAFEGCTGLKNVTINGAPIPKLCFSGCSSLESVLIQHILGSGSEPGIGDNAFKDCNSLKKIEQMTTNMETAEIFTAQLTNQDQTNVEEFGLSEKALEGCPLKIKEPEPEPEPEPVSSVKAATDLLGLTPERAMELLGNDYEVTYYYGGTVANYKNLGIIIPMQLDVIDRVIVSSTSFPLTNGYGQYDYLRGKMTAEGIGGIIGWNNMEYSENVMDGTIDIFVRISDNLTARYTPAGAEDNYYISWLTMYS